MDRSGTYPIVRGVLLCGPISANGRDYPSKAFAGPAVKKYEGKSVFLNHSIKANQSRDVRDKLAWIENARHREDGMPIADIGFNPKHVETESILWAAEHKPGYCGMSHVAHCRTNRKNGRDVVEEIIGVESVDIVVDPATTHGFFEQEQQPMKIKLAAFAEWVAKNPKSTVAQCLKVKQLAEEYDDAETDAPADDAEVGSAIDDAFRSLLHAHVDELLSDSQTVDDFMKKVKALHKAHKGKDAKKDDAPADDEGDEPADDDAEESKKPKTIGFEKAIALCSEAKYQASPSEYRMLAKCEDEEEAKAFISEQAAKSVVNPDKPPRSAGRTVASPPPAKSEPVKEQRRIPAWDAYNVAAN